MLSIKLREIKYSILNIVFRVFYIFPLKNKIFLSAYEGKQFSCNPKYIYLSLKEKTDRLTYVWEYNKKEIDENIKDEIIVRHNSLLYIYHILTSKVIIVNSGLNALFPIRRKQIVINTWHGGGAFKKCGLDISKKEYNTIKKSADNTTYMLSSSKKFSEIMKNSILMKENKLLEIGMPRNAYLLNATKEDVLNIKSKLNIEKDKKVVLYAPTFRGNVGRGESFKFEPLDTNKLLINLEKRFGSEFICLYRGHYFDTNNIFDNVVDVSSYPDMQDLLLLADILITDYSSSIWDYSLLYKPAFLYTPDLESYKIERNFYTSIDTWPFDYALNNSELESLIKNFDFEINNKKIDKYKEFLESTEDKNSTDIISDLILKNI